jgi:hypothetical protein
MFRNGGQYLGLSFLILSLANGVTTLCAVLYNEQDAALVFAAMSLLFLLSGLFLRRRH